MKQDKILGKVAIKQQDLASYNNKDHWFEIKAVDADSEVQGKANIEVNMETNYNRNGTLNSKRLLVRVVECSDLTLKNGSCDPYAAVKVVYSNKKYVMKRTKARKKTVNPQFDEVFSFDFYDGDSDFNNQGEICDLFVTIFHENEHVFLGQVRIPFMSKEHQNAALGNAW